MKFWLIANGYLDPAVDKIYSFISVCAVRTLRKKLWKVSIEKRMNWTACGSIFLQEITMKILLLYLNLEFLWPFGISVLGRDRVRERKILFSWPESSFVDIIIAFIGCDWGKTSVRIGCRWDHWQDFPIAKPPLYQLSYGRSVWFCSCENYSTLSHGKAVVERGFSVNGVWLSSH